MNKSFEGPVDALINWRFSMRITRILARRSLAGTPNHVTIAAIAVGLVAAWLARRGGRPLGALGGGGLGGPPVPAPRGGRLARAGQPWRPAAGGAGGRAAGAQLDPRLVRRRARAAALPVLPARPVARQPVG